MTPDLERFGERVAGDILDMAGEMHTTYASSGDFTSFYFHFVFSMLHTTKNVTQGFL